MRIMHMVNHCGKANGHVNVSVDIACIQAGSGHEVGYTCSKGDFIDLLESRGVKVFSVCEPHKSLRQFFAAYYMFYRAVKEFQPDVIHAHMAAQVVLTLPFRLIGYKTVTTVHNEFDSSVWLMGLASRIVTVSKAGAVAMIKRGFSKRRVRVVLNGTIGTPRLPASFQPAEIPHPAIVTVCGLHHRKGVNDLLNAFKIIAAAFPATSLYILGEGPSEAEYRQLAHTLGISERVHFLGFLADPRPYLHAADIFVLASHADPGPLVIAEARNAGCAIVSTNVDGIPEMLDQGAAGILVEPKNPPQLAGAIMKLLADPLELARLSKLARLNVERFTIDRVCRDLDEVYNDATQTMSWKAAE